MKIPFSLSFDILTSDNFITTAISSMTLTVLLKEPNEAAFDEINDTLGLLSQFSESGALQSSFEGALGLYPSS